MTVTACITRAYGSGADLWRRENKANFPAGGMAGMARPAPDREGRCAKQSQSAGALPCAAFEAGGLDRFEGLPFGPVGV